MNTQYQYQLQTLSGSSFDNLESVSERVQDSLNGPEVADKISEGWELWQISNLHGPHVNGTILIYRRPAS